jgi:dTDP-4-amino-4,6-dideoxygalactose transaminase
VSRIWLSSPHLGGKEQEYVNEAFNTNWVAPLGPNVDSFEQQLTDYLSVNGVVSLSSGSGALHLALVALGIKTGDVVLCQSFTFAASAFPITYCGAIPVFVDSESDSWNMDPELLEQAIIEHIELGKIPAAIIVVHLYGMPAKMDEIISVAKKYGIPVIEDAAEALGSTFKNKPCGSFGEAAILSFNGNKIITTSGGGAFASNNAELVKKVRHISAQAKEPAPYYLHKEIGYNYRMSNICAGIGRGQMEVLPERIKRRREIFEIYKDELGKIEGINFLSEPDGCYSNRWLTTILFSEQHFSVGKNEALRLHLEKQNIESRPLWKPLHQQPVFAENKAYINGVSDMLFATGLCLPSGSNLKDEVLEMVIAEIKSFLK